MSTASEPTKVITSQFSSGSISLYDKNYAKISSKLLTTKSNMTKLQDSVAANLAGTAKQTTDINTRVVSYIIS